MGILGYVEIQIPSIKAGRRRTFIAKIIGEFNFRNILRWRGIEPRSPAWQARILPLNHQSYRYFIPTLQFFESDISVKQRGGKTHHNFTYALWLKFECELLGWTQYFQLDTDLKNRELRMILVKKWKSVAGKI